MDMQMPVMDGLTATRAIRSIERQWGTAAVPIIAITANARAQDIEKSHQAGCNVHLSKPISKLKLFHVIEDYRIRGWRETIGIEMQPGLEEITPGYLAARREEVPVLMALLAASDFKRIAHLAHRIKGTGTSYGFGELSRISAALEAAAERRDSSATGAQLGQLTNYLEHVQLIAQEVRPPAEAPDTILRDQ
jgi:CheY-like chemotaxis protein